MNIYNLLKNEITLQELLNYYNANITLIDLPNYIYGFIFQYEIDELENASKTINISHNLSPYGNPLI